MMIFFLLFGLVLLYFGAEWLVKGSSRIALRHGVSSLVVGLTVVAFGTSAPELVVSLKAGFTGLYDISLGNVIGSNIFNIVVILGISAMIQPMKVNLKVLKMDMPVLLAVTFILIFFLRDNAISRIEGLLLFGGIVFYTVNTIRMGKKEGLALAAVAENKEIKSCEGSVLTDILFTVSGLALLVGGSHFFVKGAIDLARAFNVSDAIIGLTIVAAGTSLPELATSVVAAIRKEEDIAIGNIVGSNIFNILAILGITGSLVPLQSSGIGMVDLAFMAGTAVVLLPLMRTGFKISRIEGFILLATYGGYIYHQSLLLI
jgi:cation:H+ antiporter